MSPNTQLRVARAGVAAILLVPAALVVGLALRSGGFFPDATAVAVVAVLLILVVWATTASAPFAGLSPWLSVAAITMTGFAIWTLISGSWSNAPARATLEYHRTLLYVSVLVLTGLVGRSARRARLLLYGLAIAGAGLSIAAAATWLLPDVVHAGQDFSRDRLGWPTSYWNATGLIAALTLVWTASLSSSATERPVVRVLAATGTPFAVATLIFTVSRGAVAVACLGLVVAVVAIRSRATPGGILALAPVIGLTTVIALRVSGLNTDAPGHRAIADGHRTALALVAVALGAAALRLVLLVLDRRLMAATTRIPDVRAQRMLAGAAAALVVIVFIGLGGPARVRAAAHKFVAADSQSVGSNVPAAQRLTRLGNNGRIDQWRVAYRDGFRRHPLTGTGAGTYAVVWPRFAPTDRRVLDAHSLYIEQLGELGLVGVALLVAALGSIVLALARRARGPEREVWAALLAGTVVWAVHAGVDWDWEMPAITAWVFAAGGLALAAPVGRLRGGNARSGGDARRGVRLGVGLGCLLLAVGPAFAWRSQTRLSAAVAALETGDCLHAESDALDSNAAMGSRPEPFEVISYCEAGAQRFAPALSAIHAAQRRDPQNWELRYSEALINAVDGRHPQAAAQAALARYPTSPLTRAAARAFSRGGPRAWRRFAISAPLPLPPPPRR
jgi:hypothetical protein